MIAEIISIGDELLNGTKLNTNGNWLADRLLQVGIQTRWISVIGDDKESIKTALLQSKSRSHIVLLTGGLGPTHDDITKESVADFFETPLVRNENLEKHIIKLFSKRGIPMPEINLEQATVPRNAKILQNKIGSAPGLYFCQDDTHCFVLPGVPAEMRQITEDSVLPILKKQFGDLGGVVQFQTIRTTGIFESKLFEELQPIEEIENYGKLAFLPHPYGVDLRLCVTGEDKSESSRKSNVAVKVIKDRINPFIYEVGSRSLEEIVAGLLLEKKKTVSVAESCTGGLIANLLTNIVGSSAYFWGGVVAYDNSIKSNVLGVKKSTLQKYGAVSEEVALEMAAGVRNAFNSDFALATTGIAGPTGATENKPVGLVYIGLASPNKIVAKKYIFHRNRWINKSRFSYASLNMLRKSLMGL